MGNLFYLVYAMEIILKYFDNFTPIQLKQLEQLQDLYRDWNEKINVISRKDIDNFYLHHVLHSLSIAAQFEFGPGDQIMDLGCGGGFPGVPLAIFFPDAYFHMVDSIQKKLKVVQSISEAVGLQNITVQHSRAEDIKNRKFNTVVSRAVAPLGELWKWSKPLLKKNERIPERDNRPNGLICLKGGDLTKEIFESGCKPFIWEMEKIFPETYFQQKYVLYQKL